MTEQSSDEQMRKYLAAFADGELDVQESLHVLEHMKMNPQATGRVMHHQQMRRLVDRAMREDVPATPPAVRQAIMERADREAASERRHARGGVLGRIGRWAPLGLAAVLVLGVYLVGPATSAPGPAEPRMVSLVSSDQAKHFERRHVECSRALDRLKDRAMFPDRLEEVSEAVERYFGGGRMMPSLDLSAMGFRFDGLGKCAVPGKPAVHLVYHATDAAQEDGAPDALSLWITPYRGRIDIEEHVLYVAPGVEYSAGQTHPILIWRSGDMMHYLVGDHYNQAERAAAQLIGSRS